MVQVRIKATGEIISMDEFALLLYKEGQHIVYCDIECIAKDIEGKDYYLIDECGNCLWIDPEKYEVMA